MYSVGVIYMKPIISFCGFNFVCPVHAGLMYIMLPMPCLFFGGGSSNFMSGEGGE